MAKAAQSEISMQHGTEMKNSGIGPRWALVCNLAPSLNSCVMGTDRYGQQIATWVPVRSDARWYPRFCQLTHSKWTTSISSDDLGPCLSAPERGGGPRYLKWDGILRESPFLCLIKRAPDKTHCFSSIQNPSTDPSTFSFSRSRVAPANVCVEQLFHVILIQLVCRIVLGNLSRKNGSSQTLLVVTTV